MVLYYLCVIVGQTKKKSKYRRAIYGRTCFGCARMLRSLDRVFFFSIRVNRAAAVAGFFLQSQVQRLILMSLILVTSHVRPPACNYDCDCNCVLIALAKKKI